MACGVLSTGRNNRAHELLSRTCLSVIARPAGLACPLIRFVAVRDSGEALPANTLIIAQAILCGDPLLESRLAENLSALPDQKLLWLIDEADTEAQRIANAIKATSVEVILCTTFPHAMNPKLWKLQHLPNPRRHRFSVCSTTIRRLALKVPPP